MGKIKKLKDVELVGGTEQSDVYPITSTKAIYDENNKRLDSIISELQKSADSSLETENKTIVGSINELKRLLDKGYLFKGVATPDTNPGVVKQKVFYIATTPGTYTNLGRLVVADGEVAILKYDTSWTKEATGIATAESVSQLGQKVDNNLVSVSQSTLSIGSEEVGELAGQLIENPEWVQVVTDSEGKILYGVKTDGKFYFGDGCPPQVQEYVLAHQAEIETALATKVNKVEGKSLIDSDFASSQSVIGNPEYLEVKTDFGNKILEAITADGRKQINIPLETPPSIEFYNDNIEWAKVHLNKYGRVINGVRKDGSTYIGQFDNDTTDKIRKICVENKNFSIPLLNSEFSSPVPLKVYNGDTEDESVKGTDVAKYIFNLSLGERAFNIRFKFRITENIYNEQKNCVIAYLGQTPIVSAFPQKLVQHTTQVTYGGQDKTMYWPTLKGGIAMGQNLSLQYSALNNNNLGLFAFYIKYIGTSQDVTIENNGSAFVVKIDGVATTYSYVDYPTIPALYDALKNTTDIEVACGSIEGRNCTELAIFDESKLVSLCYTRTDGNPNSSIEEYWDSAPFFIPYAVDESWHQVEVVKIQDNVYSVCDGNTHNIGSISNVLTLGGECGVLFKDLEVCCKTESDAEITDVGVISGASPNILIFEGHDMDTRPTYQIPNPSTSLATTPDRLQHLFGYLKSRGYIPISIKDIADYYDGSKALPKRYFVPIFDDYEFENCMERKNRSVFTSFGVKPVLAIITGYSSSHTITHNGDTISIQEASNICKIYDFYLVSHTRNHRSCTSIKPSEYLNELIKDINDGDIKGVDNSMLVYPFGDSNAYLTDTLKWLGYKLGIQVAPDSSFNKKARRRYSLMRHEIGLRVSLQEIINKII